MEHNEVKWTKAMHMSSVVEQLISYEFCKTAKNMGLTDEEIDRISHYQRKLEWLAKQAKTHPQVAEKFSQSFIDALKNLADERNKIAHSFLCLREADKIFVVSVFDKEKKEREPYGDKELQQIIDLANKMLRHMEKKAICGLSIEKN